MKKHILWVALFVGSLAPVSPASALPVGGGGGGTGCRSCDCVVEYWAHDIVCTCLGTSGGAGCLVSRDARRCTTLAGPCTPAIGGIAF